MSTPDTAAENLSPGASMIAIERYRQIATEGWTPEHDDDYKDAELAKAAAAYIDAGLVAQGGDVSTFFPRDWPWERQWWKPSGDPIRNLVKAGALIAAEIDRLHRAGF